MPLETYKGSNIREMMNRAVRDLGPDAMVLKIRRIRHWDGTTQFELLAGDEDGNEEATDRFVAFGEAAERSSANLDDDSFAPTSGGTNGPRIIALVGPTGAGKTTTIAKLIGNRNVFRNRRVGVIGLDVFRVGGAEQLRTYAEMTGVPLLIASGFNDIDAVRNRLAQCDVILVDTPGRGPRHQADWEILDRWLGRLAPDEVHLTLPAGLSDKYRNRLVREYRKRGMTHLIATKLDELPGDWSLFEMAAEMHLPMRWATDGQEVPADLRPARPRLMATMAAQKTNHTSVAEGETCATRPSFSVR